MKEMKRRRREKKKEVGRSRQKSCRGGRKEGSDGKRMGEIGHGREDDG